MCAANYMKAGSREDAGRIFGRFDNVRSQEGVKTHRRGVLPTMVLILCVFWAVPEAFGSDWPQFMRNSEHNGDAADEQFVMPLNLVAQIKLGDGVMNSPAVVGGLVYVVDQMGKAYCIDPNAEPMIVWESAPESNGAYGSNTASPCVAGGRVYFGTTAGNVHILNAANGNLIKTVSLGSSIVSGLTWANDSLYFQTLDAIIYCLDSDGDMYADSGDLELVYGKAGGHNGQEQIIGIRFQNVTIDPNASISNAYIQFAVDETSSTSCSLTIKGAAIDNTLVFTTIAHNISNRGTTTASVNWSPPHGARAFPVRISAQLTYHPLSQRL